MDLSSTDELIARFRSETMARFVSQLLASWAQASEPKAEAGNGYPERSYPWRVTFRVVEAKLPYVRHMILWYGGTLIKERE